MSLTAKDSGGDFELVPEGMHVARCYRVIDMGTQYNEHFQKSAHKVIISWEFPEELMSDGRPFATTKRYTVSLHKKATLRQHLESWRGRKFTDEERNGFEISKLLYKTCYVNIVHEANGENTYANVAAITPLPKGVTCPSAVNEQIILDLDVGSFDQSVFDNLSDKLKEQIKGTPEWKNLELAWSGGISGEKQPLPVDTEDVPF